MHAALHLGAHPPFLDARDELAGNRAADDLVDELEAAALRKWLHFDVAHRELAVSAGLLDVAAVALGRTTEGLTQRDPDFDSVDVDAVTARQRVEHHAGVRFAHTPQHDLMSFGVLLDAQLGSSAASRCKPTESLSSSVLARAAIATGSSGSGMVHGLSSSGSVLSDNVSPVSARVSLPIAQMSPATTCLAARCCLPNGNDSVPMRSSSS